MMRRRSERHLGITFATALAAIVAAARPAGAACAFVVDAAGGGTHATIQAAVDALPAAGPCRIDVRAGTYHEALVIAGKNASASGEEARVVIVAERGTTLAAAGDRPAIAIDATRMLTIEGFTIAGAAAGAIAIDASADVAIARNDVHNNGAGPRGGGILVGPESDRVWIVNNLIRSNGRNGVEIASGGGAGPVYVVNNTILWNGWNGIRMDRRREVYAVNNLVVGNGTDGGTAGGRWGLASDGTPQPGGGAVMNNVFYRNGARAAAGAGGDIIENGERLTDADVGNVTTAGAGVAGCVVSDCSGAPLSAFFPGSGFGPDFRLNAGAPAAGRGVASFVNQGREWVPGVDFDGVPREKSDRSDVGCYQRMRH